MNSRHAVDESVRYAVGAAMSDALYPQGRFSGISPEALDLTKWPEVDIAAHSELQRQRFIRRRHAIELYVSGADVREVEDAGGVSAIQVSRLIKRRCLQLHPDGRLWGWRALIPHVRLEPHIRSAKVRPTPAGGGSAGALRQVLMRCGDIQLEERLRARILKREPSNRLDIARAGRQSVHRWFLAQLRPLGYEARNEWPFNVGKLGYNAICEYMDRVIKSAPLAGALALGGGPDAKAKMKAGDGTKRPPLRVFQRVECDSHKLDGLFIVLVPNPAGGYSEKMVRRLWVTVVEEVASRAVLGYWLTLRREVPSEDVLRAIKSALSPWRRREISFSSDAYTEDAALPSGHAPAYVGACWDEFCVDGAMALKCKDVAQALEQVVRASILSPNDSFLARRSKDDRPYIETFFRTLGSRGLQHLSNSTMGNPRAKAGRRPEAVAVNSSVQLEYLQELLDVIIANYNATPHSSLGWRSPLQQLDFLTQQGTVGIRHANPQLVQQLLSSRQACTVKGGQATGRAAYINFAGARYTSDALRYRFDLVGQRIWVSLMNEDDARFVQASTDTGVILGVLHALPPWHRTPHSLFIRRSINSLANKRLFHLSSNRCPIELFAEYAESQPKKKLPPHGAYLEVRRILEEQGDLANLAPDRRPDEANEKPTGRSRTAASDDNPIPPLPPRERAVQK